MNSRPMFYGAPSIGAFDIIFFWFSHQYTYTYAHAHTHTTSTTSPIMPLIANIYFLIASIYFSVFVCGLPFSVRKIFCIKMITTWTTSLIMPLIIAIKLLKKCILLQTLSFLVFLPIYFNAIISNTFIS